MNHPTVYGTSGIRELPPTRFYVYGGDDKWTPTPTRAPAPECAVTGCTKHAHAKGFCDKHYYALTTHGNPEAPDHRRKENK